MPDCRIGIAAQALQRQRGLGLAADLGDRLAQQAQLQRRGVARLVAGAAEQAAQEPELAHRPQQRPVDAAVVPGQRGHLLGRRLARPAGEPLVLGAQAKLGHPVTIADS